MADEKKESPPPYVAYKTFKNFLRSLSQAMPSRIDKSVMTSLAGGTQSQLLHALKFFGLITNTGAPSDKLRSLVKADGAEYQKLLRDLLESHYPFLQLELVDLATVTTQHLQEQFEQLANGDTVRKCMTFFIPAAKDAGLTLSPYIKEPGKRTVSPKPRKGKGAVVIELPPPPPPGHQHQQPEASWKAMLLAKFPELDPTWPDEVKAKWFESFQQLMAKGDAP